VKKIIIHTEEIKKVGAKVQFQIKLPSTIKQVKGVLITANPNVIGGVTKRKEEVPPNENPPVTIPTESERGWVWLRIPEKRDVFFADIVRFENHQRPTLHGIVQEGISSRSEKWFSGSKREFFKVSVPIEDTLIEGFYVDRSKDRTVDYKVKIYLELELNKTC